MKIVILDKENFLMDFPPLSIDCEWVEYPHTSPEEVIPHLQDADIAITHKVKLEGRHFAQLPRLKMVSTNSTGYDTINADDCKRYHITLCNVRDWCTNSVVEHILSFIFALKRNIIPYNTAIRQGEWQRFSKGSYVVLYPPQSEIAGSTIGIFGHGVLGAHLAKRASALDMNVLIAERKNASATREGYTDFYTVVSQSDILVMLSPLNRSTYKMIGKAEFGKMKSNAILINCARGGLVDEAALLNALENKTIAGAALDVMEQEPPADNYPLLQYKGDNLLLSSHVAFVSIESLANNTRQIVANIEKFCEGKPQNIVADF
jgi:glycerate dehydrogenase